MGVIDIKGAIVVPIRFESLGKEEYNPFTEQIGGVLDGRFVFISRDGRVSTFPGIEPPDYWCSIFNGKAIYYIKDGESFIKVLGRDAIKITGYLAHDPDSFYFADPYHGPKLSAEQMEDDPLVKYVKELMLAR